MPSAKLALDLASGLNMQAPDRRTDPATRARVDALVPVLTDAECEEALAAAFPIPPVPSLRSADHRACCPWRASSFNHRPMPEECCCEDGRRVCERHGAQP